MPARSKPLPCEAGIQVKRELAMLLFFFLSYMADEIILYFT